MTVIIYEKELNVKIEKWSEHFGQDMDKFRDRSAPRSYFFLKKFSFSKCKRVSFQQIDTCLACSTPAPMHPDAMGGPYTRKNDPSTTEPRLM